MISITRWCVNLLALFGLTEVIMGQNTGLVSSWTTSTGGSIYLNRLLNLKCEGIDVHDVTVTGPEYSIQFTDTDTHRVGCSYFRSWILSSMLPQGIVLQNEVPDSYCQTLPETDIFTITLNVTSELSSYNTLCKYVDESGETSKSFDLPTIQEAPENLRLVLSPEVVIEGSPFTVECMSDGAVPASSFVYEIFESGSWRELSSASYTPTISDRSGLSVRCRDTAHPNWDIISEITKSIDIQLLYIDFGETASADDQIREFRPGTAFDNYELTCDLIGNPEVANYTWTTDKSDVDLTVETSRALTLKNSLRLNGEVETVTCSGAIEGIHIDFGETASADDQIGEFRPGTALDNYELTCDLIGNPEVGDYSWTTDSGRDFTGENNSMLTLDNSLRVNEDRLTITWIITWTEAATTTTTTTITPEPQKSKAGLYGGIGGAIVLLVIVGVVIAVVLIRKRKGSATKADKFAVTPNFALPQTSANDEYDLPPVESNTNAGGIQTITSVRPADKMYEQLQMRVSDGVYSQPDEHLYSGLMKRTQQTQPFTGGRDSMANISTARITDDPSGEYVNCANLTTQ